jgi:hypothetical protein
LETGRQQEAFALIMACGILFCTYNMYMVRIESEVDTVILATVASCYDWIANTAWTVLQVRCDYFIGICLPVSLTHGNEENDIVNMLYVCFSTQGPYFRAESLAITMAAGLLPFNSTVNAPLPAENAEFMARLRLSYPVAYDTWAGVAFEDGAMVFGAGVDEKTVEVLYRNSTTANPYTDR